MKNNEIKQAVNLLRQGEVIAFPIQTTCGLGCDPRDTEAIKKIFKLKGRPHDKFMPLVVSSFAQVNKMAVLKGTALKLAKKYWPEPLSLILPAKNKNGMVGVRAHSAKEVMETFGNKRQGAIKI